MLDRRKSSKSLSFKKILPFVLTLILLICLYLIINSPFFIIKSIDLEKHNVGCATDLEIQQSSFILGQNFLFFNTKEVVENLKNKFICIKTVAVEREFPDKVRLKISGREAKLMLVPLLNKEASISGLENIATPSANDYTDVFLADDEGIIFSKGNTDVNLAKIFVYEKVVNLGNNLQEQITNIVKILDKVKIFGINIQSAKIINSEILITDTKPLIVFKLNEKVEIQLASLQLILRQAKIDSNTLEFIDLRFDKPIVRFAPKKK